MRYFVALAPAWMLFLRPEKVAKTMISSNKMPHFMHMR